MSQEPKKSKKLRAALITAKWGLITAFTLSGCVAVSRCIDLVGNYLGVQYAYARDAVRERLTEVKVVERTTVIDLETIPVDDLIEHYAKEGGLNPAILRALAAQESGRFLPTDRVRYEKHLLYGYTDGKGKFHPPVVFPPQGLNEIERQLWASSIGLTQVIYGLHRQRCRLPSPSSLFDPSVALACTVQILRENLKSCAHIQSPGRRLREALRMYNGKGEDAEQYADRVMQRVADMVLLDLGTGV